jgi:polyphosphate glucokinase
VLLGGGNAKLMKYLPSHVIVGANSNAIEGGIRLWQSPDERNIVIASRKDAAEKIIEKRLVKRKAAK